MVLSMVNVWESMLDSETFFGLQMRCMSDVAIGIVLGYVWAEPRSMWPNLIEMVMSFSLSALVPC
jgi:hypothetical protein